MGWNQYTRSNLVALCVYLLSTIASIMRLSMRAWVQRQVGIDDYFILLATILNTALLPLHFGLVNSLNDMVNVIQRSNGAPEAMPEAMKLLTLEHKYDYAASIIYFIVFCMIKLSILTFFRRFLPKKYRVSLYTLAASIAIYSTVAVFIQIFRCIPIRYSWVVGEKEKCAVEKPILHIAIQILHLVTDVIILGLPISTFVHLHTNKKKKIGLLIVFSIGAATSVASGLRLNGLFVLQAAITRGTLTLPDLALIICDLVMWSQVELATAVFCANVPTLVALRNHFTQRLKSRQSKKSRTTDIYGDRSTVLEKDENGGSSAADGSRKSRRIGSEQRIGADSDSSIEMELTQPHAGIMRSTEVTVDVETV